MFQTTVLPEKEPSVEDVPRLLSTQPCHAKLNDPTYHDLQGVPDREKL